MNNYQSLLLASISDSIEEMKNDVLKAWIPCIDELTQYSNSLASESLREMQNTIRATLGDVFSMHQLVTTSIQETCDECIKPISEVLMQLHPALSASNRDQLNQIRDTLQSFESSLSKIFIHSDYVEMPVELTSDNFSSTDDIFFPKDIEPNTSPKGDAENGVRKLSFSEAIIFICTLIQTLIAIISFLQTQLDTSHEQLIELQKQQVSLQIEENELIQRNNQLLQEQIDATYKQTKYLVDLLEQIQDTTENSYMNSEATLETDSMSPYSDSQFQCADSNTETVVPEPSTVSDQSDNFESQTAPEPY